MTRKHWYLVTTIVAVFAIVAGGRYASRARSGEARTQPGAVGAAPKSSDRNGGFHMPSSADKVRITARIEPAGGQTAPAAVMVRLDIRKGWHVNANPASLPFLIPTVEKASIAGKPIALDIAYPPGGNSHIVLQGTAIRVYDDGTVLKALLSRQAQDRFKAAGRLILAVTVQSCSDKGICLPPATLTSNLPHHS